MKRREFIDLISKYSLASLLFNFEPDKLKLLDKIDLKEKNFSLYYRMYLGIVPLGEACIMYSKEKQIVDLTLNNVFTKRRYSTKLNGDSWENYKEDFDLDFRVLEDSTYYTSDKQGNVTIYQPSAGDLSAIEVGRIENFRKLYNPLEVVFRILGNNMDTNFDFIANRKINKNVRLEIKKGADGSVITAHSEQPFIERFHEVEALLRNNIPFNGYIYTIKPRIGFYGEISSINVEGKKLF